MPETSLTIKLVLTLLAQTPPRIAVLTDGLSSAPLHVSPKPGDWSANDVLAHLRACADVWGDCIAEIIRLDKPTLRAVNPRSWIKRTDYLDQEFHSALRAFATQRTLLLTLLEPLPRKGWSRSATITGAGSPLKRTVFSYAGWLATHERPHTKQIERIVNTLRINKESK